MPVTLLNPAGLAKGRGFAQVSIARGSRLIHVAGQVGEDSDGNPVGLGDLAAQTERAIENVVTALAAADAHYSDVVKVTVYVAGWNEAKMEALAAGFRAAASKLGIDTVKPMTLVGVATLGRQEWLVELDVTAIAEDGRAGGPRRRSLRHAWQPAGPRGDAGRSRGSRG
jgi:enamine deaminase RidA (YjgF/YER057c/UK114 family)